MIITLFMIYGLVIGFIMFSVITSIYKKALLQILSKLDRTNLVYDDILTLSKINIFNVRKRTKENNIKILKDLYKIETSDIDNSCILECVRIVNQEQARLDNKRRIYHNNDQYSFVRGIIGKNPRSKQTRLLYILTKEEVELFKLLCRGRTHTITELACLFGVTDNTIASIRHKLNLGKCKRNDIDHNLATMALIFYLVEYTTYSVKSISILAKTSEDIVISFISGTSSKRKEER